MKYFKRRHKRSGNVNTSKTPISLKNIHQCIITMYQKIIEFWSGACIWVLNHQIDQNCLNKLMKTNIFEIVKMFFTVYKFKKSEILVDVTWNRSHNIFHLYSRSPFFKYLLFVCKPAKLIVFSIFRISKNLRQARHKANRTR